MPRRILFVDAGSLSVFRSSHGRVDIEAEFAAGTEGFARFGMFLAAQRDSLYYMLADVAEESFQREDIPHLRGSDRIAIIKRKLARHYPATPFTAALSLGRQAQGRRDERMLFAALTRPQQFEPWLRALNAESIALAGLFSLPQIAVALAGPSCGDGPFLLVTLTRGGLRQTFIEQGRMRFSRLTPFAFGTMEEAARACAEEAVRTCRYLDGQRLMSDEAAMTVRVLAHPEQVAIFRAHCQDSHQMRYEYLDLSAHAARCGLKTALLDSRAEALSAHLLIRRTPRAQFAHADTRRIFRLGQIRFALSSASAAVLAICLLFAGWQTIGYRQFHAATVRLHAENESDERRYQGQLAGLPDLPIPAEQLFALTDRYENLLQRSPGPAPTYRQLSAALQDSPEITLQRLNWAIANRMESDGRDPAADGLFAVAEIEADLPTETTEDAQMQSVLIERFVGRLRRDPWIRVQVLGLPPDTESDKPMTGGSDIVSAPPKFMLRVVQRLERPWH